MKEIQHYDKAANRFYKNQFFTALPLASWDLFADEFKTTIEGLNDVVKF